MHDQGAGDRKHLSLSARQIAGGGAALAHEIREGRVHLVHTRWDFTPLEDAAGDSEIVLDRHQGKDILCLRHEGQAKPHHGMGRCCGDVLAVQEHRAAGDRDEAGDRLDEARFAGAVGTKDDDDLAFSDSDRGAAHDRHARLVAGFEIADIEDGFAHAVPPR